jgi:DNA repair exonuclease SbcCD nuclease subunit
MKKIYVKINGTLKEYEDTPQVRQGLHLDKQIAEQAGKDFKIFDPEQLSDEDALKLGVRTQKEIDARKKEIRKSEIISELNQIDMKSIRPARAGETARLAELEAEAEKLRKELAGINV